MQITAAILREVNGPFLLEQVELAEPREDEILVRLHAVGLCHSDIAVQEQSLPFALPAVIGHEGAGIVEKVGSAIDSVKPGDKVVLTMTTCGECTNCTRNNPMYCERQVTLNYAGVRKDGTPTICSHGQRISAGFFGQSSFATYALSNQRNTVKLRDDADLSLAAPLGCGIQTGAGTVLRTLDAQPGRALVVFGGGSVGLSAVMAAKLRGCDPIILVEPVEARRTLAIQLGATHAIDPFREDVRGRVIAITGRGADYAVDTTANVKVLESAFASMAMRGEMAILGVPRDPAASISLSLMGFLSKGLILKGAIEGDSNPSEFIPAMYDLYLEGRFPINRIITTYRFSDINQAVEDQLSGKVVKPVLTFF